MAGVDVLDDINTGFRIRDGRPPAWVERASRSAGWLAAGAAAAVLAVVGGLAAWWLDQTRGR